MNSSRTAPTSEETPSERGSAASSYNAPLVQRNSSDGPPKSNGKIHRTASRIKELLVGQWFVLALGLLIAISSQIQVPLAHQQLKETVVTYLCVSLIFLITGCTLPTRTLIDNYSRWMLHLFVQVQCFLMTSAVTFAIVSAAATNKSFMDPGLLVGLVFVGCVPTTISSNVVMTREAHGNTALTVVQSTIGNFLGPFLTPVLLTMYTSGDAWYTAFLPKESGGYGEIYRRVFKQLGLSIFVPMVVGQLLQNVFPGLTKTVFTEWRLSKLSSFCLLIIIWQTYDQAFSAGAFTSVPGSNIVFIVFISIGLFLLWLGISFLTSIPWLPKKDTVSICYCVPAKTPAMGVPLSAVMYLSLSALDQSKLQIPMVVFQGLQIVGGSLLTAVFRRWARSEESEK